MSKTKVVYKLTKQDLTTYKGYQYVVGKPAITNGHGQLCGPGWLHAYSDPLLALIMNPDHANFTNPRLWKAVATLPMKDDNGLKCGTTQLTLVNELVVPKLSSNQRILFAIIVAQEALRITGLKIPVWDEWAKEGLESGKPATRYAAAADAAAADAAAKYDAAKYAAARYAAADAKYAADAAKYAADAAKYAADAARYAAAAASYAADAAAKYDAAKYAADAATKLLQKGLHYLKVRWPELNIDPTQHLND